MITHKVVIVTGSSRGIGADTAKLFAEHGYAVCINYKLNKASAQKVRDEILKAGSKCIVVKADVSLSSEVAHLFNTAERELGKVSVLVNNAAILKHQSPMEGIDEDRFNEVLRVNVIGCFLCCREAVKRMSTKNGGVGGTIVNVSSMAALTGSPNEYVDYAASKGAVDALTKGLALEVADKGIRVNAVRPALIHTDMHASGGETNRIKRLQSKIPLQRGGRPKEVAEAILWLASEKSSFVTGSFIDVSGGM